MFARRPAPPPSDRGTAESDLVSIRIEVGRLADAVRVGLPLGGLQSPFRYPDPPGVEVVDEDGLHGMAGMLGAPFDVYEPVFGELPQGLGVVREERGRGAEQPFVPDECRGVVAGRYSCEEVDGHSATLCATAHHVCEPISPPRPSTDLAVHTARRRLTPRLIRLAAQVSRFCRAVRTSTPRRRLGEVRDRPSRDAEF